MASTINEQMFFAMRVSEVSKVPVLFLSNPGVGKSSSVWKFADNRGYELITIRGNSTTYDEIMGYDTVPEGVREGTHRAAVGLRPSWFQQMKDNEADGKKTLLFLDELTTATEYVQAALLHLIFERSCKDEKFPEDTLVVAAGNYAQNLTTSMQLLSPIMNRFAIYNLRPAAKVDLKVFLNKFDGAASNQNHIPNDNMAVLSNILKKMDAAELTISQEHYNRIGEFFETSIRTTAENVLSRKIDWNITDLSSIYSEPDPTDSRVYGFLSLRTLNYLRDMALATYVCFGSDGIRGANFQNLINGLVGIGLKMEKKEAKSVAIGDDFKAAIENCLPNIEKLGNSAVTEYENFFSTVMNGKSTLDKADFIALNNKLSDLQKDPSLKNIKRPLAETFVRKFLELVQDTSKGLTNDLTSWISQAFQNNSETVSEDCIEKLGGMIESWNYVVEFYNNLGQLLNEPDFHYLGSEKTAHYSVIEKSLQPYQLKLQAQRKKVMTRVPGVIFPSFKSIKQFNF
mgnify:CR=1 FL=1